MNLTVHANHDAGELVHFWQSTGFTPGPLLLDPCMKQTLAYLGSIPCGGLTFVRIHHLLQLARAKNLGTDQPIYDWSKLDEGLDWMVACGLKPFFELMGNVEGYFDNYEDPVQMQAWRRLVRDLAEHLMERYGRDEVESWYFECWNEPDVGWWKQSREALFCYFDASVAGLGEANERLTIGGPGTALHLSDALKDFLRHCDSGTNRITGKTGTRLDFISVHEKGRFASRMDVDPDSQDIIDRTRAVVAYLHEHHPRFADLPIINNECDPHVGWKDSHTWRARPYYAAIATKIIVQHIRQLIDEGVRFTFLSNDNGFLGHWGQRTQLAGWRDRDDPERFELVKKPVLNVMSLWAMLGDRRCEVEGGTVDLGALGSRRGDDLAVMVYHSRDRIASDGCEPVSLTFTGLELGEYRLVHYRIDEQHGDPFTAWASAVHPSSRPDKTMYARMREQQELQRLDDPRDVTPDGGKLTIEFDLPLHAVSLVMLCPRTDGEPPQVTGLRGQHDRGMTDDENVLLTWDGLAGRHVRTYEVLFAPGEGDAFERVNGPDLVCSAFLHVRPPCPGGGRYKVRAVDLWDRPGPESDILAI